MDATRFQGSSAKLQLGHTWPDPRLWEKRYWANMGGSGIYSVPARVEFQLHSFDIITVTSLGVLNIVYMFPWGSIQLLWTTVSLVIHLSVNSFYWHKQVFQILLQYKKWQFLSCSHSYSWHILWQETFES